MKELATKALSPAVGVISTIASWEIWQSIIVSLVLAFVGGFLAHCGKLLAQRTIEKRKEKSNEVKTRNKDSRCKA